MHSALELKNINCNTFFILYTLFYAMIRSGLEILRVPWTWDAEPSLVPTRPYNSTENPLLGSLVFKAISHIVDKIYTGNIIFISKTFTHENRVSVIFLKLKRKSAQARRNYEKIRF